MRPILSGPGTVAKRVIDLVGSVGALIVIAPLLGVLAVLVRRDSDGPAFFCQERVGRDFRPFQIIKLRTMMVDTSGRRALLTTEGDRRITPVGRWLRRLKLDELPQLLNVARGDMSLVGPRPEVRKYVELRRRDYEIILTVRPGLTDPASLKYRNEASLLGRVGDPEETYVTRILPDKIQLAKEYITRASVAFDAWMIVRTLFAVTAHAIRRVASRDRPSAGGIIGLVHASIPRPTARHAAASFRGAYRRGHDHYEPGCKGGAQMNGMRFASAVLVLALLVITLPVGQPRAQDQEIDLPVFEVDPSWPTLPNDWVLGQVASVTVDRRDQVWVLHRPRTVPEEEQAVAAPPVLVFDVDGTFVRAWGGPADGYEWPANEHGIHADHEGNIWIGGNGSEPASDDMLLKFTPEGELLLQIGRRGQSDGNADTENLKRPAESFVYPETNEVFVADGYGNRRVIVLDAKTGAFKRMWGGFGGEPRDPPPAGARAAGGGGVPRGEGPGPQQFGTVHGIEVSADGRVYVADRNNGRIQRFTLDGAFLEQRFVNPDGESSLTVAGMAFSGDWEQMFIYVADQGNSRIHVVDRKTLEVLESFGRNGERPGEFRALHHIATDSQGNLYTAEAQRGRRAQKFRFLGMASWL